MPKRETDQEGDRSRWEEQVREDVTQRAGRPWEDLMGRDSVEDPE